MFALELAHARASGWLVEFRCAGVEMSDVRERKATRRARLGRTDVEVTRLALGTAPLGGWPAATTPTTAHETIQAAWDAGLRFFDTAPLYGHGLSESWLGDVLATKPRAEFTLATKVGRLLRPVPPTEPMLFSGTPPVNPVFDFSYDGTMRSFEESLQRLRLPRVDVVHIHDPDDHYDEAIRGAYRALYSLRRDGVVRAIGAGMNQSQMLTRFAVEGEFDCFLLAGRYTLLEQGALDDLLPTCLERGISVIAGGVFNSGVLINPVPGAHYNYAPADPEIVERCRQIVEVCTRHGVPVKAAALQFPLAHPAVACVLTGVRSPSELMENLEAFEFPIPSDLWTELKHRGLLAENAPVPSEAQDGP
jgi:D-threo-aldose 1-dehydrogenase